MSKYVRTHEAALILETTLNSIMVTACAFKRQHGKYPQWYSSNGAKGASKSYVDVEHLLSQYALQRDYQVVGSTALYWEMLDIGIKRQELAEILAEQSETFTKKSSWLSFMVFGLFVEPAFKFTYGVTRVAEFYRICNEIKEQRQQAA